MSSKQPTAAFLIIGNEILSGRTQDKNLNYLATKLTAQGIRFAQARVVPDIPEDIIEAVQALSKKYDYVFTSGGIGPTHDDITAENVAKAMGTELELKPEALARLKKHYENSTQDFNDARKKMAYVPKGATLIDNLVTAAPGFAVGNVYVMAGIPSIFQAMVDATLPLLEGGEPTRARTVTTNITEGSVAQELGEIEAAYEGLDIGSYPHIRNGKLGTSLVARSQDEAVLEEVEAKLQALVQEKGGEILPN